MEYQIIMADPPWPGYPDYKSEGPADRHYPARTVREIREWSGVTRSASAKGALLFLWTPPDYLPQAIDTMHAWGFSYRSHIAWINTGTIGHGLYVRMEHELCLLGRRGSDLASYRDPARVKYPSVIQAPPAPDSRKPAEIYELAETFGSPRLELFASAPRPGWDAWGDDELENNLRK